MISNQTVLLVVSTQLLFRFWKFQKKILMKFEVKTEVVRKNGDSLLRVLTTFLNKMYCLNERKRLYLRVVVVDEVDDFVNQMMTICESWKQENVSV